MKARTMLILLGILLITLLLYGCFQRLVAYDGTYQGRIIDAETGEPLEGVVVLGVWHTETRSQ